jgi:glutamate-5-semialdehyde dehydrogenase
MQQMVDELETKAKRAREATRSLAFVSTSVKNRALQAVAARLRQHADRVIAANAQDYEEARASGMNAAMLDRLMLDQARIAAIADDVRTVAALPDPIGQVFDSRTLPNGLQLSKRRVPLGVVAAIYESRPNVTVDISSLCLKSGKPVYCAGARNRAGPIWALASTVQGHAGLRVVPKGSRIPRIHDRVLARGSLACVTNRPRDSARWCCAHSPVLRRLDGWVNRWKGVCHA